MTPRFRTDNYSRSLIEAQLVVALHSHVSPALKGDVPAAPTE
jgi:hypothetical protein